MPARWIRAGLMVLWILASLSIAVQLSSRTASTGAITANGDSAGRPVAVLGCTQAVCPKGP